MNLSLRTLFYSLAVTSLTLTGCGDDSDSTRKGLFSRQVIAPTANKMEGIWEASESDDGLTITIRMQFDGTRATVDSICRTGGKEAYVSGSSNYSLGTDSLTGDKTITFENSIQKTVNSNGVACSMNIPGGVAFAYTISGLTMTIDSQSVRMTFAMISD